MSIPEAARHRAPGAAYPLVPEKGPATGTDDRDKAIALRRMKLVALGFLIGAAVLYVISTAALHRGAPSWVAFVQRACEAGMVGGLADWFAVTALFRHPLGVPIPHTALIPRRKAELGDSLAEFVGTHFLHREAVATRLAGIDLPSRAGRFLSNPDRVTQLTADLCHGARGTIAVMRDDAVRPVLEEAVLTRARDTQVSAVLGRFLEEVVDGGTHRQAVDLIANSALTWARENQAAVVEAVANRAPEWTPRWADELIGMKAHTELVRVLREITEQPDHDVRRSLDDYLRELARELREDPQTMAKVEQLKGNLLDAPEVRDVFSQTVSAARRLVLAMLDDPDSELRRQIGRALTDLGRRLLTDRELADKINERLSDAIGYLVTEHGHEITALITETLDGWDGADASRRIELHVGRDLQFIRINGTLVGALVGLLIHTLTVLAA